MKNFLRVTMLAICAIFMVANVSAQVITAERASEIANQFFANGKQKSAAFRSTNATLTQSIDSRAVTGESNDAPTFHILTGANGKGFVIVSGEETENPIIGYSFDGTIDTSNLPDGFVDYMTDIDAQVRALREYNAANPQKAAARSAMQKAADFEYNANTMGNIVKDLNTAPWGQRTPFNNLCKTTDGQTALTGCGPTAFAILCYYYKWPASGVGTVTHQGTGENMELGNTYDYASMRNDDYRSGYTEAEANAVAVLMRDLGWACEVGYGTGSTSYGETSRHLTEHFYYKDIRTANSNSGATYRNDDEEWKRLIKESLDKEYPIPYSSTTGGTLRHIYILDGYTDNDYYHFNWGWSGQGNGWFTLNNMVPDDYSNYSNSHRAYFNLIPDKTTYTVTATVNDSNMGTVSINGGTAGSTATADFFSGATATLTAHPAQGYALANWTKNGVVVGSRNTIQVTVGTDANDYVANFDDEANVYVIKDYIISPSTVGLTGSSKESVVNYVTSNEYPAALSLASTATNGTSLSAMSRINDDQIRLYAYDQATSSTTVKYTLSVPDGYQITEYKFDYSLNSTSYPCTITYSGGTISPNNTTWTSSPAIVNNAKTAEFTISAENANSSSNFFIKNFIVTVAKISSEGGGSTQTTYAINATAGAGGSVKINGEAVSQKSVNENSTVTLVATPQTGYRFVNWTSGASSVVSTDATYSFTATGNTSLVANFEKTSYTVSVAAGEGGVAYIGTKGTTQATATYNGNVTITAEANDGYRFVEWRAYDSHFSSNAQQDVTVTTDVTYTAVFEAEANAPVEVSGNLEFTFTRNGSDVDVAVSGAEGVTATIVATSPDATNTTTKTGVWNTGGAMANRTDVLCTSTNTSRATEGSPITYTLTVNGLKANITAAKFTNIAVNNGGGLQDVNNSTRQCNFKLDANGETVKTLSDQNIWVTSGTENTIAFNDLSVNADGTLTIKLTIYKGTDNAGCYYGLKKITLTAAEAAEPEQPGDEETPLPEPEYPEPTGATFTNNYLTSVTTTGANENISYTANTHPGNKVVTLPGTVRIEKGGSFTLNLVAKSLSSNTSSVYEDMRYCHASLFTDFDCDGSFGTAAQTWGNQPPTNNVAGNYSSVMNITHTITVPADAPLGTSHVRMIYTNAWKGMPTNGTADLDKGIVYDIVVEVVKPSNEKTLNVTYSGATWNNEASGWWVSVTTTNEPAVTVATAGGGKAIGYSTVNTVKHPYLLDDNSFTISIPAPYKIIGYRLTYKTHNLNGKTFTCTGLTDPVTAGQDNVEQTIAVTGLENSEIAISVSDQSSQAGVIITALEITYVEDTDLETYTVAVTAGENGTATASAATVAEGDNVTLTATANTDYKFVGWYNGETKVSEANPYTFAVTSNISYEARFEELFPDGAYKVYWQADNRGYLAYHGTDYPNEAKLAGVTYSGCQNLHYGINDADLVWYLITASDGKRYLFEVATGKFLGVDTSVQANGTGNKLSTTEAWPIAIEENTKHTGHYIITTMISGTNSLLCSGCGTPKEQHPVRWLTVNDNNQTDGGAPLQLVKVDDVIVADNVMSAVRAVIEPKTFQFKAEVENWRNDNPNTHLGTITIGGTPLKLTPEHLRASELTMPLNEGSALAFTRKYRGFEFQGFYIGETELGKTPTLTADNVDAIDENNPLIAKFTATDDVTLFYDDDEFSYRIPAIAKTGTNRLVAVSDYRHSHDDIGRDNHSTGTLRVDLVMRTSDDNGATWTAKQTIAEGTSSFGYGDAAVVANGENILVMAVAGNVFFANANANNKQRTYRIYSPDNGATWNKEEVSNNLYTLFPNGYGMFFGSGKLVVDPNFNNSGNARVYGAVLLNDGNNYVVYSDNWGSTWNILGGRAAASANEPKVEILPNGQILLSARRNGGRTFNVFTYTDKANNAGTWSTATNGCDNGGNGTNGEIILLDAKRPNGTPTKILLQSQPYGGDRRNVSIWYKEISANETYTASSIASGWEKGKQVSTQLSAYSAMCLQENGEIALFFEEAPCHNDDHTYGYSMVYVPLTIEEITGGNFLNPNAVVETVTVDVTLTDEQGNTYTHQFDYLPGDAAAIDAALKAAYPFITLGTTGAIADNTYTNTVTLPFKVSNANTTVWHNIYWPANTRENDYPVYLSASTADDVYVPKVTGSYAYGNHPTYNTLDGNEKISWAIYNVNNGFEFIFKNKVTDKYIQVTSVADNHAQNVQYVENIEDATAFTIFNKPAGNDYYTTAQYALAAKVGETTGYLCSTSATGYNYATHYFNNSNNGYGHQGAWIEFVEAPDYQGIYDKLIADINNFGDGEGKYKDDNSISGINKDALRTMLFSDLTAQATAVQTVKDSYTEITLTVPAVNDVVPGSVKILNESVSHKFVPKGNVTIEAFPAAGYRFVNWTRPAAQASAAARTAEARNSNVVSDQNPYTVTVSEALSLEANFEEIVVNATLTDAQGNTYNVQLSGFTAEITKEAVADKLREAYPYITLGTVENVITLNENNGAYTYTNTVELPFKVTNTTYIWHNIYWPSNTKNNDWPVYLSASTADDVYVPKVTGSYAYGDHPTYNTKSGNNNISWAIYNVNNGFKFIFKNKVTQKYIRIRNVADEGAQNVQFVENAEDATAFTIEMKPEGQAYDTDAIYSLAAMFGETKGYLCSTSATGYNYATHYNSNEHQGAWVKFVEAPDYFSKIQDLGIMLGYKFGPGDGKYIITDAISEIDNDIANNSENITLNTIKQDSTVLNDAINSWPAVGLTINPAEGGTTNINGEENVVHKYVPNEYELPLVAVPAEGYHFVSWTDGISEIETVEYTKTISGGKGDVIELTANFAKNSYTVNVSTNGIGGSATASATTVEHGNAVTLTAVENDGYDFAGWYNGEVLVSAEATYTFPVTSDINYTARFEEEAGETPTTHAMHIIVSSTDGTDVTNSENGNVKAVFEMNNDWIRDYDFADGADVILVATPDYREQAYLFDGWYKNGVLVSNELSHPVKATEDATYEARFFRGCVIIGRSNSNSLGYIQSITLADGTSLGYDASNRAVVREGTTVKLNPYYNEKGYIVGNWTDVNRNVVSEDESLIIQVNEDVTYTANFEPVSYKLTVRANDDSYGTVNAVSEIESGTTIKVGNAMVATLTATANYGYKFVYWTKGSDVVSYDAEYTVPAIADVSKTEDTEYVANFVELETAEPGVYYRFAYRFPAAAAASAARTGATRAAGDTYTYTVTPQNGGITNATKVSEWNSTETNPVILSLTATCGGTPVATIQRNANTSFKLYGYNAANQTEIKYTISVPDGYIITNYQFTCLQRSAGIVTIKYDGNEENYGDTSEHTISVSPNEKTAEFVLSTTSTTNNWLVVKLFTVTIQEVGSSEGEGEGEGEGGETPSVDKYYIQSEACDVTNKTNALLMTQDGESASSIFYYDNNKLLSYKEGRYLDESNSARGLQAVGAAVGDIEIIENKIKVSNGTTVVYLHANKNEGTSTTYFVDHCTSNDGSDNGDEEHNFIVEEVTKLPVTISSALHATFYAPVAVEIPEGVKAYVLKAEDIPGVETYAWMTRLQNGIIPANTGVIIKGAEGTYYFNIVDNSVEHYDDARAEAVGNVLSGTVAKTKITEDAYILANREGNIGLYPVAKNSYLDNNTNETTVRFTNNSHKAYLPVRNDWFGDELKKGTGFRFVYDDEETTGIDEFETELEDTIYDLQGRKLSEITEPGIYIVNGKKIFVK